jgi:hypothetical protein
VAANREAQQHAEQVRGATGLPALHSRQVAPGQHCGQHPPQGSRRVANGFQDFGSLELATLCDPLQLELAQAKRVVGYALDSGALFVLQATPQGWQIPRPSKAGQDRPLALLVFPERAPNESEQQQLKRSLDINIDRQWSNGSDIQQLLRRQQWPTVEVYTLRLAAH